MLNIQNLSVSIDQKIIIDSLSLSIKPGALHVLMGPNGSGKSTLAAALMGHPAYQVHAQRLHLNDVDLQPLSVDKRAQQGLFLGFQHPYEIEGVSVFSFLKEAHFACTKKNISVQDFSALLKQAMDCLHIDSSFAQRALNCGFSGGEKKRLELLQMILIRPTCAILDEIDSGLDVDAVKIVAQGLQTARAAAPAMSILLITHYPRLLAYVQPDAIHVLHKGSIVRSGDAQLAHAIEQKGYDAVI